MKGKDKLVCNAVRTRFAEKPYDFMKVYALILRWASVKHNVSKDDLEIGYYFYNGYHFSFKEFNDICIQLGTVRGVFSRFKKKGYIVSIAVEVDGQMRESGYFVLSIEFSNIIRSIKYSFVFFHIKARKLISVVEVNCSFLTKKLSPTFISLNGN